MRHLLLSLVVTSIALSTSESAFGAPSFLTVDMPSATATTVCLATTGAVPVLRGLDASGRGLFETSGIQGWFCETPAPTVPSGTLLYSVGYRYSTSPSSFTVDDGSGVISLFAPRAVVSDAPSPPYPLGVSFNGLPPTATVSGIGIEQTVVAGGAGFAPFRRDSDAHPSWVSFRNPSAGISVLYEISTGIVFSLEVEQKLDAFRVQLYGSLSSIDRFELLDGRGAVVATTAAMTDLFGLLTVHPEAKALRGWLGEASKVVAFPQVTYASDGFTVHIPRTETSVCRFGCRASEVFAFAPFAYPMAGFGSHCQRGFGESCHVLAPGQNDVVVRDVVLSSVTFVDTYATDDGYDSIDQMSELGGIEGSLNTGALKVWVPEVRTGVQATTTLTRLGRTFRSTATQTWSSPLTIAATSFTPDFGATVLIDGDAAAPPDVFRYNLGIYNTPSGLMGRAAPGSPVSLSAGTTSTRLLVDATGTFPLGQSTAVSVVEAGTTHETVAALQAAQTAHATNLVVGVDEMELVRATKMLEIVDARGRDWSASTAHGAPVLSPDSTRFPLDTTKLSDGLVTVEWADPTGVASPGAASGLLHLVVDNTPPTLKVSAASGRAGSPILIPFQASDANGVRVFVSDPTGPETEIPSDAPYVVTRPHATKGLVVFTARDKAGNTTSVNVSVTALGGLYKTSGSIKIRTSFRHEQLAARIETPWRGTITVELRRHGHTIRTKRVKTRVPFGKIAVTRIGFATAHLPVGRYTLRITARASGGKFLKRRSVTIRIRRR